ncbi:MAG TPA: hypothetical protein VFS59_02705 [Gemmatimonadaceae bacterium]|nr:hypothetical protein [Gemmatimonadaceae bacterium]
MRTRLLAVAAVALALGCSSDDADYVTDPITPMGLDLAISPKVDTLILDAANGVATTTKLSVTATSMGRVVTTPPGRVFETADTSVVVVDPRTGEVFPVGLGTARVSVRVNDVKDFATVVVLPIVQSVRVTSSVPQALAGDTIVVSATVIGWDGQPLANQPITFSSSSPAATVSSTGRVVFSAPGTAVITARSGTAMATVSLTALRREFIGGAAGSIASGMDATCGLLPLGKTFCFGAGSRIGIARDTSCFAGTKSSDGDPCTLVPLQIAGTLQLTAVTVGDSVACGIDAQSRAHCWGDNSYGEVGNGIAAPGTSVLPHLVTGPLGGAATFTKIAAGSAHVCALDPTGLAYCWGKDSTYQLGGGDSLAINSSTPIPVFGKIVFSAIVAGRTHSCGIRAADRAALCWGDNRKSQLGTGRPDTLIDRPTPVAGAIAFTQLAALGDFTCGLATNGSIYCWGENTSGQTGQTPDTTRRTPIPTAIPGSGYSAVTAGWSHACALSGGVASCWGDNFYGQLGNGTWNSSANPAPSAINGFTFSAISAGSRSTCAVGVDGAYCWGSSVYGATGNQIQALKVLSPSKTATPR